MKKIYQKLEYGVVLAAMKLVGLCRRDVFFFFAPFFGRILYCFPQIGTVALQNITAAFPEKTPEEQKRIARKSVEHLFLSICEFFWSKGRKGFLEELCDFSGEPEETAKAAHEHESDGLIFISPHHGNWEFAGMALALHYHFKVGTVVRTARNPYLDKLISSGRMVDGVHIIHSKGAARGMVNALKNGYAVGTLIDQNTRVRDGGIFVNFFSLPVPVSRAPASIARKANHFIATGTVVRVGKRFKVLFKQLPKPTSAYASDEELTQDILHISEEFIRAYPEQYLWMYKRFQYIPRDAGKDLIRRYPPYATIANQRFYDKGYARRNPQKD